MQGLIVEYFTFYKVAITNALAFDISRLRNDQPFHHYILPAYAGVAAERYPPPPPPTQGISLHYDHIVKHYLGSNTT